MAGQYCDLLGAQGLPTELKPFAKWIELQGGDVTRLK